MYNDENSACSDKQNIKNGCVNGISRNIQNNLLQWADNISVIDLQNSNISHLDNSIKFPSNTIHLNLSNNNLKVVPLPVLQLGKIKTLNLSFNIIQYFDTVPNFCHSIEQLNIAHNHLQGPPYWIWSESATNLKELDLSNNLKITTSFDNNIYYFAEFLQCQILATDVKIHNCVLRKHIELLGTFPSVKTLQVGCYALSCLYRNQIEDVPSQGLEKCCDIERLILCNLNICNIKSNIDILCNLKEIDLSENNIGSLPNEFCNLMNLETCVLSGNYLLYLPDDIVKLKKLIILRLDQNEICILPNNMSELENLKLLDLYNNGLYEAPKDIHNIEKIDLAQNHFDEPIDTDYVRKKDKLRLIVSNERVHGRKVHNLKSESTYSTSLPDDEEISLNSEHSIEHEETANDRASSPEDWDSDEYWEPYYNYHGTHLTTPPQSPWLHFVKKKMAEGNFCPMDEHVVSVADMVKYEKLCNPQVWYESDGQFDDYSDDDS